MDFGLTSQFGNITFDELRSDEIEVVSGGTGAWTALAAIGAGWSLAAAGSSLAAGVEITSGATAAVYMAAGATVAIGAAVAVVGVVAVGAAAYAYFG